MRQALNNSMCEVFVKKWKRLVNFFICILLLTAFIKEVKASTSNLWQGSDSRAATRDFGSEISSDQANIYDFRNIKAKVIYNTIENKAIELKASRMGISVDNHKIKREVSWTRQYFRSSNQWESYLKKKGITAKELEDEIRAKMLREQVLAKLLGNITVPETDVRRYYDEHQKNFILSQEEFRGRVATAPLPIGISAKAKRVAKQKIGVVRGQWMKDDGNCGGPEPGVGTTPFCSDVRHLPIDIGAIIRTASTGTVSSILETANAYKVFQITEHSPAQFLSYEQVRDDIRYHLLQEKRAKAERAALDKLIKEANPEILMKFDKDTGK